MTSLYFLLLGVILLMTSIVHGGNTLPRASGDRSFGVRNMAKSAINNLKTTLRMNDLKIKQLSILMVAPGLYFSKSHLSFALSIAKILVEKHKVTFVVTCRDENESQVNETHPNLSIKYYCPQDTALKEKFMNAERDGHIIVEFWKVFREMVDTKFLKGQKFHVGIAESSTINLYAFALFHSLEIKKTVTIKAYSLGPQLYHDLTDSDNRPKKENETYMDPLKNADPPIPVVDKTKIGDHDDERICERKDEIKKQYDDDVKAAHDKFNELDEEFKGLLPGFPGSAQMYYETRFLWSNSLPQLEWDGGKILKSSKKFAFIGGVHFKKDPGNVDQAISDKLNKMNESKTMEKSGKKAKVILVSFGTVVNTIRKMNNEQFLAIRNTIKDFATENPQYLFVWQLTEGDERIDQLNSSDDLTNVYATNWINMQALLAHKIRISKRKKKEPIVAVFLSHCGRNSQLESVYYSIPTICVPNFMDQYYNAEVLAKLQMSIVLDFKKHSGTDDNTAEDAFTTERIKHALSQELGKVEMLDKVKNVGKEVSNQVKTSSPRKVILDHMEKIKKELNVEANL